MATAEGEARGYSSHKARWRSILYNFGQNTTLHGVRQATEPTPFPIRRLIWVFIVVAGFTLFVHHTVENIMYYRSWPVAVNIKINYNDTLRFPAVTICNQNAFTMTRTARRGLYHTVGRMFSGQGNGYFTDKHGTNGTYTNYSGGDEKSVWDMSLTELYNVTAHRKEDFIVSCRWDHMPCGPDDFRPILTDHGVCFTFNGDSSHSDARYAAQPGAEWGLRLRLNIEQYEYMKGPNEGAGVKVLVHDPEEIPLVGELGQAVAPGTHAQLGIQVFHMLGLKPPYGRCHDEASQLTYFSQYTLAGCYTECKQLHLVAECGCRHFYMPAGRHPDTAPPVCDLKRFLDCIKPTLESFMTNESACACPHPCDRMLFDMAITSSATSNFDMANLLDTDTSQLEKRHVDAREQAQRLDDVTVLLDAAQATNLINKVTLINKIMDETVRVLNESMSYWSKRLDELGKRIHFHSMRGLGGVKYCVVHDFLRGFEIIDERAVSHVPGAFFETEASVRRVLHMLDTEWQNATLFERKGLWFVVDDHLQNKQTMAERLLDNLTEIKHSYDTGRRLLTFEATLGERYDFTFVPYHLIRVDPKEHAYFYDCKRELLKYINMIDDIREIGQGTVHHNKTDRVKLDESLKIFIKAAKRINYKIFLFRDRVVKRPLSLVNKIIHDFTLLNESMFAEYASVRSCVSLITSLIADFKSGSWSRIEASAAKYKAYTDNAMTKKYQVAFVFTTRLMREDILVLKNSFSSLKSRGRDLTDAWRRLKTKTLQVFVSMANEPSTKKFYRMVHEDVLDYIRYPNKSAFYLPIFADLLRVNVEDVAAVEPSDFLTLLNGDFPPVDLLSAVAEITNFFHKYLLGKTDISAAIQLHDEELISLLWEIRTTLERYLEGNAIDYNFFRQNFLNLDVYIRELSYQQIAQQRAYDLTNLWSDIGGCIGLFVGASLITAFEIIDIFIHTAWKMRKSPQRKEPAKAWQKDGNVTTQFGLTS